MDNRSQEMGRVGGTTDARGAENQNWSAIVSWDRYARKGQILFTGSSLMEQFPINELLMSNGMPQVIYNRGIGGFTTDDMLQHMEEMVFGTETLPDFY